MKNEKRKTSPAASKPIGEPVPVAVLTITFLPPQDRIANISPHYPAQMAASEVLHILRRAEEALIGHLTAAAQRSEAGEGVTHADGN